MSKTIWKFPLEITDRQLVTMPDTFNPLSVQFQGDTLCLWAIVDPESETVARWITIHGTGHPVNDTGLTFIGTAQDTHSLVWHIFLEL